MAFVRTVRRFAINGKRDIMPSLKRKTVSKDVSETSAKKPVDKDSSDPEYTHWLVKSEPESRLEVIIF